MSHIKMFVPPFLVSELCLFENCKKNLKSLLLISMPNSAITVSQIHIPPKTHFEKAVGGVKKFLCGHLSRMKVTSN